MVNTPQVVWCIATNTSNVSLFLAPSSVPQIVTALATGPTIVFVTWKHVDCIDRNSEISGYTVRYGPVGGTPVNDSISGTNHRTYTAVGLTPSTNYSIEVKAVNNDGEVGPFSSPIFVRTPDLDSEYLLSNSIVSCNMHRW